MSEAQPLPRARRRFGRWLAVGLALCGAWIAGSDLDVLATTRARELAAVADAPVRPYALVLGNRVFHGGVPSSELARRLEVGLALYANGRARRLIVSGMCRPEQDYDEPGAMAAWLEARGVPAADVILDRGGYRTAASMADAAAIGARSLLVVSQAYHLPRALYLAAHAGIDALGVPAVPGRRRFLYGLHMAIRETAARAETVAEVWLRGVRGAGPVPAAP
jgi:vancomycin permeability regulator SanA